MRTSALATFLAYLIFHVLTLGTFLSIEDLSIEPEIHPGVALKLVGVAGNLFATSVLMAIPDYLTLMTVRSAITVLISARRRASRLVGVLVAILGPLVYGVGMLMGLVFLSWLALKIQPHPEQLFPWYEPGMSFAAFLAMGVVAARAVDWIIMASTGFPLYLATLWLGLYAASGFLVKAFRHFDIGFQWLNRRFDTENKPLKSIGLVAGVLVAVVYWTAVIVSRFL